MKDLSSLIDGYFKEPLNVAKQSEEASEITFSNNQEALALLRQLLDEVKMEYECAEGFYEHAVQQQKLGLDKLAHGHCSRVEDKLNQVMTSAAKASVLAHRIVDTKPESRHL